MFKNRIGGITINPKKFPYEKFLSIKEEKEKSFLKFLNGEEWFVPVVQRPAASDHFGALCRYADKSLESQLECLSAYLTLESDYIYSYLEPWHGVGVYASAFGSPFTWYDHDAPQTLPIYTTLEEVINFSKPDIDNCEIMQKVLETIKYFRKQTGDMLDISLTDTQSPNDNASLIVDTCEFFIMTITEMEKIHPFMQSITDTMIKFTEMQIEALGKTFTSPGHLMISSPYLKGISISDDNMAVISPSSYETSSLPYNQQLSKHFGGLAVHTCGSLQHNASLLLKTEGLKMVDCAIGKAVDPTPNNPKILKEIFAGTDLVLKVRLGSHEIDLLDDIVDKDIKLIVEISTEGSIDDKNRQYYKAKQKIHDIC